VKLRHELQGKLPPDIQIYKGEGCNMENENEKLMVQEALDLGVLHHAEEENSSFGSDESLKQ